MVLAVLAAGCGTRAAAPLPARRPTVDRADIRADRGEENEVRIRRIVYVAHDGRPRRAFLVLPRWYMPRRNPALPLVIAPHGRGIGGLATAALWGNLPADGHFALVCPEGQGHRLMLYSWGDPGEIDDLARMPAIVEEALPWVRIDPGRIYTFGTSMGGQEALLLLARDPRLLAGVAAFDAPTNLASRYDAFHELHRDRRLQHLLAVEVGGTPETDPRGYAIRSPLDDARRIAFSRVPLQLWWSTRDRVVSDQRRESGLLYRRILGDNPLAPVREVVGTWRHSTEFRATRALPDALARFGLMPPFRRAARALQPPTSRGAARPSPP